MGRLGILDGGLDAFDPLLNVAIGDEDIQPPIKIEVEKETAESKRQQAGSPNCRPGRFIHEQSVSFVVIEGQHFVGKVCDQHAGKTRPVIICRGYPHSRARDALIAVCDSG